MVSHLGRPPKMPIETPQQKYRKRKKVAQRNHIEGKFGQAKRGYGMNNIKARLPETAESWINAIIFVMNLTKLMQLAQKYPSIFMSYSKSFKNWMKRILEFDSNQKISTIVSWRHVFAI